MSIEERVESLELSVRRLRGITGVLFATLTAGVLLGIGGAPDRDETSAERMTVDRLYVRDRVVIEGDGDEKTLLRPGLVSLTRTRGVDNRQLAMLNIVDDSAQLVLEAIGDRRSSVNATAHQQIAFVSTDNESRGRDRGWYDLNQTTIRSTTDAPIEALDLRHHPDDGGQAFVTSLEFSNTRHEHVRPGDASWQKLADENVPLFDP